MFQDPGRRRMGRRRTRKAVRENAQFWVRLKIRALYALNERSKHFDGDFGRMHPQICKSFSHAFIIDGFRIVQSSYRQIVAKPIAHYQTIKRRGRVRCWPCDCGSGQTGLSGDFPNRRLGPVAPYHALFRPGRVGEARRVLKQTDPSQAWRPVLGYFLEGR